MFGLTNPKLPLSLEDKDWVDNSFLKLATLLGSDRLLCATVVLPTSEHFPDPYDHSETSLKTMFHRVARYMRVDPDGIDVSLFVSGNHLTSRLTPFYSGTSSGAAGLYHDNKSDRPHISVDESELKDPMALVAVLAHEIGHVILLGPGLVDHEHPEMEPLNDLLTVFLGFGIFTANAAFRFEQHSDYQSQGWSARRVGYLSEQHLGYALARFAFERSERKPAWKSFLSTNIAAYMRKSAAWLANGPRPLLLGERKLTNSDGS